MGVLRGAWRRRFIFSIPLALLFIPFLISVRERHPISIPEEPKVMRSKKSDHLILGPAAGQGMPDRLQCQGLKALNVTLSSTSSQTSSFSDKISFVTVFALYNNSLPIYSSHTSDESTNVVTVGNLSYSKPEKSMAILNTYVDFIKVSMPQSSVIILTDPSSEFSIKRKHVTVLPIRGDYSREKLMLQRIRSYIAFLETKLDENLEAPMWDNHYIFTDSDIAVVDDLGHIFQDHTHFHLALTFRNNRDQPLNSGFIAVRGTHDGILKAKRFLQGVLEVYNTRYVKASRMLGDQLALAWIVKSHLSFNPQRFVKPKAFVGEIDGASVLFLPCALYNWTPPEGAGQFHGMPLDVKTIRAWYIIGRLGGCNSMNMQLSQAPLDNRRPSYDAIEGANITPSTFYNIGDLEIQDNLARLWVDIGTSEPLVLDVLINALTHISSDYVGIKQLVFGGSEFESWKESLKSEDSIYSVHKI